MNGDEDMGFLSLPDGQERRESERHAGERQRSYDTRDRDERPDLDAWSPANVLTAPPNTGGWTYRWIREYVNGVPDPNNVQRAIREKFVRLRISELPDGYVVDEDTRGDGYARSGGLILMRRHEEHTRQRRDYYRRKAQNALRSADQLQGVAGLPSVLEDRGSGRLR